MRNSCNFRGKSDSREFQRFIPKSDEPIWVAGRDATWLGEVVDISLAGFAFEYFPRDWRDGDGEGEVFLMDRFNRSGGVSVKAVYDMAVDTPGAPAEIRRRGVIFQGMAEPQRSVIEGMIHWCCHN